MRYSRLGYWGMPALAVGLLCVGALVVIEVPPHGVSMFKGALLSILAIATTGLSLSSFRYGDEVLLQMQKTAWLWGSLIATTVFAFPAMLFIGWDLVTLPPWLTPRTDPGLTFAAGMALMFLLQGAGFMVAMTFRKLPRLT